MTREEQIQELKNMRSELMAIKEKMDLGDNDSESAASSMAALRKRYFEESEGSVFQESGIEDAKQEIYSQYEEANKADAEEQGKSLVRSLRR